MATNNHTRSHRYLTRRDLLIGLTLYFVALAAILIEIGQRPAFAYNWENYTLWQGFPWWDQPSWNAFDVTDGLMTDSGRSWWVLGPAWITLGIADIGLTPIRVGTGVIAAFSAPLTWILARRLLDGMYVLPSWNRADQATVRRTIFWAAILAGLLVPTLASWLLYARTATLVGLSVTPALLTIILIDQVRRLGRHWWLWLIALQAVLLLNTWAYAPIRFLYLFAIAYFAVELLFRQSEWRRWLVVIGVSLFTLPMLLAPIDRLYGWNPVDSIREYYNARGEQVLNLREHPENFQYFLRDADLTRSPEELERDLIEQNARDLVRLFFDVDTQPAITNYWDQTGRLMPWFLAPLVLLGMLASLLRVFHTPESRLLHLMFWGFTLPMILTSKVHIGRLVFAMPLLCLFAAIGVAGIAWGLTFNFDRRHVRRPLIHVAAPILALALLLPMSVSALNDYRIEVPPSWEANLARMLVEEADQFPNGIVWIGGGDNQLEVESISMAAVRVEIDGDYQFVNLAAGESVDPNDPRPPVYFGAVTELLENATTASPLCALPWAMREGTDPLLEIVPSCQSDSIVRIS